MPGDRDDPPPVCLPDEEPLVDLEVFEAATRAFITADDDNPASAE